MRKQFSFSVLILLTLQSFPQGVWVRKADFPGPGREDAVAFSIGSSGYVGTGNDSSGKFKDFWEYSSATNQWTQLADFPGSARTRAAGMSVLGTGYIGTGIAQTYTSDFFEFNPGTSGWTSSASFGGHVREGAVAFRIGRKGYLTFGFGGIDDLNDFWEFDYDSSTWTQVSTVPDKERRGAIGFGIGNKGYLGLGFGVTGDYRSDVWEYDPATNGWVKVPKSLPSKDFPGVGRERAVSLGVDEVQKGYVLCGYKSSNSYFNDVWELDQTNGCIWTKIGFFSGAKRGGAIGFVIGRTIYIGLGRDSIGHYLTDFWAYEIPTGETEIKQDAGRVFPNPVHDRLIVETQEPQAVLTVYDSQGKKIMEANITRGSNVISCTSLPVGNYLYAIRSSEQKVSFGKILKAD